MVGLQLRSMGHRVAAGKGSTLLTHFSFKVHMAEFPMLEGKQGDFTIALS